MSDLSVDRPHNTHKSVSEDSRLISVNCVDTPRAVEMLAAELSAAGVVLSVEWYSEQAKVLSRLRLDAPTGVLSGALLNRVRHHRDDLLALVERDGERAAIVGVNAKSDRCQEIERHDTERANGGVDESTDSILEVCPWCGPIELIEYSEGLRCSRCHRWAWCFIPDSIVRGDYLNVDVEGLPID